MVEAILGNKSAKDWNVLDRIVKNEKVLDDGH
jgi:hypothetical protein